MTDWPDHIPLRGVEVMVTSDVIEGLEYEDVGTVVGHIKDHFFMPPTAIKVKFPGRLKAVELPTSGGYYEVLGKPGLEPEEE